MKISINQWEEKLIADIEIVKTSWISSQELLQQLQDMYYFYQKEIGIQPFVIVYSTEGYSIKTNHYVGILSFNSLSIMINPVIPNLTYEKLLYLESSSKSTPQTELKKNIFLLLANEENVSVEDYYLVSLLDEVTDIMVNGLIQQYISHAVVEKKISGIIDFEKQVQNNPSWEEFNLKKNIRSSDILPNQMILASLDKARTSTSIPSLLAIINIIIDFFEKEGVSLINYKDFIDIEPKELAQSFSSITRSDYNNAMTFAYYILFGIDFNQGGKQTIVPEHIIDMNFLFENYVTQGLKKIFSEGFEKKRVESLGIVPDIPKKGRFIELDGYYNFKNKNVIVDAKNKYKKIDDIGNQNNKIPSNADLFQQFYYANRMNSSKVILVYPASKSKTKPIGQFKIPFGTENVCFYCWGLNISGSPSANKKSLISLAKFINEKV